MYISTDIRSILAILQGRAKAKAHALVIRHLRDRVAKDKKSVISRGAILGGEGVHDGRGVGGHFHAGKTGLYIESRGVGATSLLYLL